MAEEFVLTTKQAAKPIPYKLTEVGDVYIPVGKKHLLTRFSAGQVPEDTDMLNVILNNASHPRMKGIFLELNLIKAGNIDTQGDMLLRKEGFAEAMREAYNREFGRNQLASK